MTAILLRIIIYVAIFAFVYYGAKKIWRDLTGLELCLEALALYAE